MMMMMMNCFCGMVDRRKAFSLISSQEHCQRSSPSRISDTPRAGLYNDYLLAPEKLVIPYDMLSDYCNKIADKYGIKVGDVKKLLPNLGDKTNYLVHYRNLQLHLLLGVKLTKIHKVLKFKSILTPKKENIL